MRLVVAELTLEAMAAVLARYENGCHEREVHRKNTLAYLVSLNKKAVKEFKQRQRGLAPSKTDLWKQLIKYKAKNTSGVTGPLVHKALRMFLEKEQGGLCCYCRRPLVNIAHAKPIEHILPRVDFVQYTFHFWNLAVACFDCNQIKTDHNWAHVSKHGVEPYPSPASFAEMYHPRFHPYAEHVRFVRIQTNDHMISIYIGTTDQGRHLCLNLLKKLSAREIMVNSNPELRDSLNVINAHAAANEGDMPPALEAFYDALGKSTSRLVNDGIG